MWKLNWKEMIQMEIENQKKKNLTLKKNIEDSKSKHIDMIIKSNKKNARWRKEERQTHLAEKYEFWDNMNDLNW